MIGPFVIDHERNPSGWDRVLRRAIEGVSAAGQAGSCMIVVRETIRSLDQNAKQWPMLHDIATQVPLTINGRESLPDVADKRAVEIRAKDWKNVLSAVFLRETRIAAYDGAVVSLGASTSQFGRRQFSEYIEFLYCVGAQHEVAWSENAIESYELYRPTTHRSNKS